MRFFFDNNLPPKLAKGLHVLVAPEHEVIHLKEKFPQNTSDEAWMNGLAKELDWVIIRATTGSRKTCMRFRPGGRRGTPHFFSNRDGRTSIFGPQAYKFVKCFPDILATARKAKNGKFFLVAGNGKIT